MTEVFGIPLIATATFKTSGKLNHVASILAELLDNDNDGCADDPNVLRNILIRKDGSLRKTVILPNLASQGVTESAATAAEKKGFLLLKMKH